MRDTLAAARAGWRRARAARRWRRFEAGSALILMYHRVADLPSDPSGIAVHPRRFEGHLDVLRRTCRPLSLRALGEGLRRAGLPERAVAITFDDGYRDNLTHARPLLERFETPATVFVVSGQLAADREFWWDELEQIALGGAPLPPELEIDLGGVRRRFSLGADAAWSEAERARHLAWSLRSPEDPTARHGLFRALSRRLRNLPPAEIRRALEELADRAELRPSVRESHATLDPAGLEALAEGELVEIGSHTVTHVKLPALDREARRREIADSRAALEERLGRRVRAFAYPFGRASGAASLVRDAGYEAACSTRAGVVGRRTDPFRLPRLGVGDWEPDELEARLRASL